MKKIISVFCVVLVVFCCMNVFEQKSQALFSEGVIVSVIGSVLLSIALSEGIAIATGGESIYTEAANAIWDYFLTGEAAGDVQEAIDKMELYGSFVYQGGKMYFALNQNGYNFFKSWIQRIDWDELHYQANLTVSSADFISVPSGGMLSNFTDKYSIGLKEQVLSITHLGYQAVYTPTNRLTLTLLNDGTTFYRTNLNPSNSNVLVLLQADNNGYINLKTGGRVSGGSEVPSTSIDNTDRYTGYPYFSTSVSVESYNTSTDYVIFDGNRTSLTYNGTNPVTVKLGDTTIATVNGTKNDYKKKCLQAGCLLTNIQNNQTSVNTDSSASSVSKPIETEEVAPAIPNNTGIGRNQVALIPVPGNTVDAEDESIILSPGEVKQYDKEGRDYTFVPVPGQLQGKTGADLGVTVMNKTEFEETSNPVYVPNYPDVFPTASPDVTITAGADVFPTVAPTEAPTAGEGTTADAIAGDLADIKDELGDLSTPLTPPQAQDGTNKMRLPTLLLQKFPFCIPYDLYNGINQFNAEAEMPSFDIPFHFAQINFDYTMHIDFEKFTTLAKICQWFFSVSWVVILILLSRKVIWK